MTKASIDYYDVVCKVAQHVNDPNLTFKRLIKTINLMRIKYSTCPELDEKQLKKAWRRFKSVPFNHILMY